MNKFCKHKQVVITLISVFFIFLYTLAQLPVNNKPDKSYNLYDHQIKTSWEDTIKQINQTVSKLIELELTSLAHQKLETGLELANKHLEKDHPVYFELFNNLGKIYYLKKEYDIAIDHYMQAKVILDKNTNGNTPEHFLLYKNLGDAFFYHFYYKEFDDPQKQKCFNKSIEYYKKALEIWNRFKDVPPDDIYNSLGVSYRNLGDNYHHKSALYKDKRYFDTTLIHYNTALKYHKMALNHRKRLLGEYHPKTAQSYNNIASVYESLSESDSIIKYHSKALAIRLAVFGSHHPRVAQSCLGLGSCGFTSRAKYDEGLPYIQKAIMASTLSFENTNIFSNPKLNSILSENLLLDALDKKGRSLFYRPKMDKSDSIMDLEMAVKTYRLAIDLIDTIRTGYHKESSKFYLVSYNEYIFYDAILASHQLYEITNEEKYKNEIFYFTEKCKAGILSDELTRLRNKQEKNIHDSLIQKENELKLAIAESEYHINQSQFHSKNDHIKKKIANLDSLYLLKSQFKNQLRELKRAYPDLFYQSCETTIPDITTIKSRLKNDEAILEYVILKPEYSSANRNILFTLLITHDLFKIYKIPVDADFFQYLDKYYAAIITKPYDLNIKEYKEYCNCAGSLYKILIDTIKHDIKGRNLVVIPHKQLGLIPFEALLTDIPDDSIMDFRHLPYLIRETSIHYAYSATLLFQNQTPYALPAKELLVIVPEYKAKWHKQETDNILKIVKGDLLIDSLASKQVIQDTVRYYSILHFNTHAFADEEDPDNSGLELYCDTINKKVSVLHAYEIPTLDLKARLAVLSACSSGKGKIQRGEGILSLARSFFYAGVPSVVMTLWDVKDRECADIMSKYYYHLKSGKQLDMALQKAKLDYLDTAHQKLAHPYYWAGYVCLGKNDCLYNNHQNFIIIVISGCLILGFLAFFIYRYRIKRR